MSVRKLQRTDGAVFFCTFTCWAWLPLIERTQVYDRVYNWMHIARGKGFRILGFVIMPNHVHLLLYAPPGPSINALLANAKRFLAYDILALLKYQGEQDLLDQLKAAVRPGDAKRGQEHRVFTTSSDIRECFDEAMIQQKLDYMHGNPVSGKWALVVNAFDYPHSSMAFYERGDPSPAPVEHFEVVLSE
jgi:REP element-mobilizing transposase RayT